MPARPNLARPAQFRVVARCEPTALAQLRALKSRIIERHSNPRTTEQGVEFARRFVFTAVAEYWDAITAAIRFDIPLPELSVKAPPTSRGMCEDATTFGRLAAAVPHQDAMYALGAVYAALLPTEHRSRNGVFFTPPPLVERLCELVTAAGFDWVRGRAIDPACGGGAFLAPLVTRMISAMANCGLGERLCRA